jgi:hypothetical protein
MHLLDEGLKRITRENKSRIFVYEEEEETIPAEALEEGSQGKEHERQNQKLIGLSSKIKTDILNVVREREEFEKAVEKLGRGTPRIRR